MGKIKIRIHPMFAFFACFLIYFGQAFLFFNYLIVLFLHEYAHAFVANRLGYEIKNISVYPFGICLNMENGEVLPNDEIKIAIAGPLVNLFLCLICVCLWWLFPVIYSYTYFFCFANFVTFLINLLPTFPLDGGRVFLSFLKLKVSKKESIKKCKIINIFVSILLLFLFVLSLFYGVNLTLLFMSIFIFLGIFDNNKNDLYTFINLNNRLKLKNKHCKVRQIAVMEDLELFRLTKFINNYSIVEFFVIKKDNNIGFRFSEFELYNIYEKVNPTTLIKDAKHLFKVGF